MLAFAFNALAYIVDEATQVPTAQALCPSLDPEVADALYEAGVGLVVDGSYALSNMGGISLIN